jgi:hypothetical protein
MRKAHTKAGLEYKSNITSKFTKLHYYKPGFIHESKGVIQTAEIKLNMGYTWEAIYRVSLITLALPLKLPTIWNRVRSDGIT